MRGKRSMEEKYWKNEEWTCTGGAKSCKQEQFSRKTRFDEHTHKYEKSLAWDKKKKKQRWMEKGKSQINWTLTTSVAVTVGERSRKYVMLEGVGMDWIYLLAQSDKLDYTLFILLNLKIFLFPIFKFWCWIWNFESGFVNISVHQITMHIYNICPDSSFWCKTWILFCNLYVLIRIQ